MENLTELQKKFIEEYLKDGNATQAAIRAGYSEKTAYRSGYRNVKNGQIQEELRKRRNEIRDQLQQQFTSDAVVARKVLYDIMNDEEANEHARLKAATDFLDRAGFKPTEKMEHSGNMNVNNPYANLTTEELRKLANRNG